MFLLNNRLFHAFCAVDRISVRSFCVSFHTCLDLHNPWSFPYSDAAVTNDDDDNDDDDDDDEDDDDDDDDDDDNDDDNDDNDDDDDYIDSWFLILSYCNTQNLWRVRKRLDLYRP